MELVCQYLFQKNSPERFQPSRRFLHKAEYSRIYINIYRPPPLTTVRCAHRALIHIRFTFIVFRYKSYLCCEKLSITQPFSYIIILTHTDYSTTELLQMVTIRLLKNPFEKLSNGSIYSMVRPTGFEPTAFRVGV